MLVYNIGFDHPKGSTDNEVLDSSPMLEKSLALWRSLVTNTSRKKKRGKKDNHVIKLLEPSSRSVKSSELISVEGPLSRDELPETMEGGFDGFILSSINKPADKDTAGKLLQVLSDPTFEIHAFVSRGVYGSIYQATMEGLPCAIKVPSAHDRSTRGAMFHGEQALSHLREVDTLNIIQKSSENRGYCDSLVSFWGVISIPSSERTPWVENEQDIPPITSLDSSLVLGYVPGQCLYQTLFDEEVYLSSLSRLLLSIDFLEAVEYLHNKCSPAILHRDIKTANLILYTEGVKASDWVASGKGKIYGIKAEEDLNTFGSYGEEFLPKVVLCDFGKATTIGADPEATVALVENGGTPRYMPPEAYNIGAEVTRAVDIWPVACCLIEILGGPVPYEDEPAWDAGPVTLERPPLIPSHFPESLKVLFRRCLSFDPTERPNISEILSFYRYLSPFDIKKLCMKTEC